MQTAYLSRWPSRWARAAALAGAAGAGLLASTHAQAQATGPCTLAGTADLAQVANLPAAASLVVAGYAPTAADPYQHLPVWKAAFPYAGQASLNYQATSLPAGRFIVFSFLDANANGRFEPSEKLARIPGTMTLSGATTGATVNYPEDCSFYTPGWKALDYFTQNPKPNFNPTTTLPYLTKWSWEESDDIALELGANWRYAVNVNVHGETEYPGGDRPLVAAIIAAPGRYKVESLTTLGNYTHPDLAGRFPSARLLDSVTNVRSDRISPAAPDTIFKWAGKRWADDFAGVRKVYPGFQVDFLLNGAEEGMETTVSGHAGGAGPWDRDPAVVRDKRAWDARFGYDNMWYLYASDRKAQQVAWVDNTAKAGFAAVQGFAPSATYYGSGYNPSMGRWWACNEWDFAYDAFRKHDATDYSATQFYYGPDGGHSGMTYLNFQVAGSPIQATNVYAGEVQYGQRIKKPYLSCGWLSSDNTSVSPPDRWMGFLKFEALCGGVSPTVSNFDDYYAAKPQRQEGAVVPTNYPYMQWIWQYFVSSHAHAAFTHLQDYITGGALVADPANNHPYNQDPYYPAARPMYMFIPEGEYDGGQPGCADAACNPYEGGKGYKAVVLARKMDGQDKHLVLAWANAGEDRMVKVAIPGLGTLALYARTAGTIYQIEGTGPTRTIEVLDPGAMNPAADLGPTPGVKSPLAAAAAATADRALRAFPNPAAGSTTLRYYLPRAGAVRLEVRDALGRAVAQPIDGPQAAGWHEVPLALPNAPDGLYLALLTSPAGQQTAKLVLHR